MSYVIDFMIFVTTVRWHGVCSFDFNPALKLGVNFPKQFFLYLDFVVMLVNLRGTQITFRTGVDSESNFISCRAPISIKKNKIKTAFKRKLKVLEELI